MPDPADYYREIYLRGLGGETPAVPVAVAELEERAVAAMEPKAASYVCAGAGSEATMAANREAFARRQIVPRMLRDVSSRDLSTTVLGTAMPAPLLLAPIGVQKVLHEDGELATARAAAAVGVPMIASTASHYSLEEIAEAGGAEAARWFQLYWPNDPELARSFVERAERSGYEAVVLTVDTFIPGWKPRDLQQAWLPFLNGMGVANYFQDPVFRAALEKTPEEDPGMATGHFLGVQANPSLSWDDLSQLREMTSLPIVIKGIQHVDDACEAVARGIDGIVVSNHGGRQVDGGLASLDALAPIAEAVGDELAILFDSGVSRRRRRAQGARPRRRRRLPRPPLPLGPGTRRAVRSRSGAEDGPRRARPDDGPQRPHPTGGDRAGAACLTSGALYGRIPPKRNTATGS
jgi:L-lactate dehydrogenase (cytochrome)